MKFSSLLSFTGLISLIGCGAVSNAYESKASYYNDRGYGSCGTSIDASSQLLVAIPPNFWTSPNPNADPLCNAQIKVTYNGRSIVVPVRDKCPSCTNNKIDLSEPVFKELAGDLGIGIINVNWEFVNSGSGIINSGGNNNNINNNGCSREVTVSAGQGCWDVWTSKCGNEWNENQFFQSNPGVTCSSLQIGQKLCCGGSSIGSPSLPISSPSSGTSNQICSRKATVNAGQGCWDVWTSKCGNQWNENQFYQSNPGVTCTALKIGQELCC